MLEKRTQPGGAWQVTRARQLFAYRHLVVEILDGIRINCFPLILTLALSQAACTIPGLCVLGIKRDKVTLKLDSVAS